MTIVPRTSNKGGGVAIAGGGGSTRGRDHHMPGPLPLVPRPSSSTARWLILLLGCYALGVTIHLVVKSGGSGCGLLLGVDRRGPAAGGGSSGWTPAALLRLGDAQAKAGLSAAAPAAESDDFRNPSLAEGPLTVVAISQSRTSSTVAFNLARILLERLDPTTVSGWESDIVGLEDDFDKEWKAKLLREALAPAHEGNLSMVVKSHSPLQPYLQAEPTPFDFVLTSYRNPYEAICSEARKFHPYLFKKPAAAQAACTERGDVDEGISSLAAKAPRGSLHADASLLWTREGLLAIAQELLDMWGVAPGTRGGVDVEAVVADVLRLEPPPPDVFAMHAPRTLLHPQHNTGSESAEGKAACKELLKTLAEDPSCRRLHERYIRLFGGERKLYRGEELMPLLQREEQ